MKPVILSAALLASMVPAVFAAEQLDECMDNAENQAAMTQCAAQAYQASDAELNEVFHDTRQRLGDDADTRRLLRDAERAWVAFRDAECAFAASAVAGGSAYPMVLDLCLNELTQSRIEQFRQYLHCEEGDMSCPVPPGE